MIPKTERIESGIQGLDRLIQGGFVKGSTNLIAGTTGTLKTIFCLQYVWHGVRNGQNGVYITLEQPAEDILAEAMQFGMDFEPYIRQKKCVVEHIFPRTFDDLDFEIFKRIKEVNASRFVLDSLPLVALASRGASAEELRAKIFDLLMRLKKYGVTSLIVGEIPEDSKALSRFGFEEFVVDSVIVMHYLEYAAGGTPRSLVIRKMRRTDHGTDIYPIEVTSKGIVVKKG
ncbi:MAG: ATPase domain-containing protein [Candidatus Aenigmarchaeota archaeon]|nr:ATPase domain-containing protein [Candidatus Aenigmarchaeota archaeon]